MYDLLEYKINHFGKFIYTSFRDVISIQIVVAILNMIALSSFSLIITPLITGEVLPFYYILIPLSFIFSLLPVVGNIVINIILILCAIKISIYYIFVALIYFLIMHKLEFLVIGKFLNKKTSVPFVYILIGMLLGEVIFHSLTGILLGSVLLVTLVKYTSVFKIKKEKN